MLGMFGEKELKFDNIRNETTLLKELLQIAIQQNRMPLDIADQLLSYECICNKDTHVLFPFLRQGYRVSNIEYHGYSLVFSCFRDSEFISNAWMRKTDNGNFFDMLYSLHGIAEISNCAVKVDDSGRIAMCCPQKEEKNSLSKADDKIDEEIVLFKILLNIAIQQNCSDKDGRICTNFFNELFDYVKMCHSDAYNLMEFLRSGYTISKIRYTKGFSLYFSCDRNYPLI